MTLSITLQGFASAEMEADHRAYCDSLGFPRLGTAETPRVAIVGGGPSIADHLDELRAFDGDIWAVNGAWRYLKGNGIDAWFVTVDPSEFVFDDARGAERAILARICHPRVLDLFIGKQVEVFDAHLGPTSVCEAVSAVIERNHREVVLFGCEGSYAGETRHAYPEERRADLVLELEVGGQKFLTQADFYSQTTFLASIIRAAPKVYSERSGGLLRAMVEHGPLCKLTSHWES